MSRLSSLGPLVSKVKEHQVEAMVDTLCSNMVSDKEQLRDISSMGLKTVIAELPPTTAGKLLMENVFTFMWDSLENNWTGHDFLYWHLSLTFKLQS